MIATAIAAIAALGCGGDVGTVAIQLIAPPGSNILERTERVVLELSNPPAVTEARRDANGALTLDLEVEADGSLGTLRIEAFDGEDNRIGVATSAVIPVAAIEGVLTLYVASPLSIGAAPAELDPPRAEVAISRLPYGAAFAGGRVANDSVTNDLVVYNVYDHAFQIGFGLPTPRAGATMITGARGRLFIYSGAGPSGDPLADLLLFDTNISPGGSYFEVDTPPELAREGAAGAALGNDQFAVLGDPALRIDGFFGEVSELGGPPLAGTITETTVAGTEAAIVIGAGTGSSGAAQIVGVTSIEIEAPEPARRADHGAAALPGGDVVAIGGQDESGALLTSALRYRIESGAFEVIDDVLASGRLGAAVTATDRYVVVAGGAGTGGEPIGDAEILDAVTLELVATAPLLVPRIGATAIPLANGQVLIAGGRDAAGDPIATLELFTPD